MPLPAEFPKAIAMWDFSWLERRWPGGGYEDWNVALDELKERGYDAIRIDAYPHLVADTDHDSHVVVPVWDQHDWGSPVELAVRVRSDLIEFIRAARERKLSIGLSTWFRDDMTRRRMLVTTPDDFAEVWITTLKLIEAEGLLDSVWYLDLCNEWPHPVWAPFLYENPYRTPQTPSRLDPVVTEWATSATARVRAAFPNIPLTLSIADGFDDIAREEISHLDFLEPHIWMADGTPGGFYDSLGYVLSAARFDPAQVDILRVGAESCFRKRRVEWEEFLSTRIAAFADWSRAVDRALVTTECWATVIWKDDPGLDWGWVKDLCAFGVRQAIAQKRWVGISTSNFCGPQYRGMWQDIGWHQELTDAIHQSGADANLLSQPSAGARAASTTPHETDGMKLPVDSNLSTEGAENA